jgi:CheY-like chemotaxis protein
MPGMDGLEVLRRLREQDASIAVIMVTASEDVGLARETLKIGAFDYVAKPFDFGYLDRAVSAALVSLGSADGSAETVIGDPWSRLVLAAFRVARPMTGPARESIGRRLEDLALSALREVGEGRPGAVLAVLRQVEVLLRAATELGDLTAADRAPLDAAVADAYKAAAG